MALVPGQIANQLFAFMQEQNSSKIEDPVAAQHEFCRKMEEMIYQAILNATYQVLPGTAIIATTTGPASNAAPITVVVA